MAKLTRCFAVKRILGQWEGIQTAGIDKQTDSQRRLIVHVPMGLCNPSNTVPITLNSRQDRGSSGFIPHVGISRLSGLDRYGEFFRMAGSVPSVLPYQSHQAGIHTSVFSQGARLFFMLFHFAAAFVFLLMSTAFVFGNLLIGHFARPKHPTQDKLRIYECGEPTIGSSWIRYNIRFYTIALQEQRDAE